MSASDCDGCIHAQRPSDRGHQCDNPNTPWRGLIVPPWVLCPWRAYDQPHREEHHDHHAHR